MLSEHSSTSEIKDYYHFLMKEYQDKIKEKKEKKRGQNESELELKDTCIFSKVISSCNCPIATTKSVC